MIKLRPFVSPKMWGSEKWVLSTHPNGCSTPYIGYDYPLLVKIIKADETLSVQVHPDDEYARRYENSLGKTECWYVLDARRGASLICGLSGEYSPSELRAAITENRLEPCLNTIRVKKGDLVFIPAGLVHAINGGLRLLEVQETSDITYRLYDWGRGREVHVDKALAVIKHTAPQVIRDFAGRFECPYFSLETLEEEARAGSEGDYSLFILAGRGKLRIQGDAAPEKTGQTVKVRKNDTVFCRASETVFIPTGLRVMKITAAGREPLV
jgi:mannose-6-phosphate isomerase